MKQVRITLPTDNPRTIANGLIDDIRSKFIINRMRSASGSYKIQVESKDKYDKLINMLDTFNKAGLEVQYEQKKFRW